MGEIPVGGQDGGVGSQEKNYLELKAKYKQTMQGVVLEFLHGLAQREERMSGVRVSFGRGSSAKQLLENTLLSGEQYLAIPTKGSYIGFSWVEMDEAGIKILAGSTDIRLISFGSGDDLKITSNIGAFSEATRVILDEIAGDIDYPIFADDRAGFRWENNAYKEKYSEGEK